MSVQERLKERKILSGSESDSILQIMMGHSQPDSECEYANRLLVFPSGSGRQGSMDYGRSCFSCREQLELKETGGGIEPGAVLNITFKHPVYDLRGIPLTCEFAGEQRILAVEAKEIEIFEMECCLCHTICPMLPIKIV